MTIDIMHGMTKHVGVINNTGKNVAIVYMQLPDDPSHALVLDTDALPAEFNDVLRRVIDSQEAQDAKNLGDILGRRMSPDGSNLTLLQKFHGAGRLERKPIEHITMTPRRGINWPLKDILEAMAQPEAEIIPGFNDLDPETRAEIAANLNKFNMHEANQDATALGVAAKQAAELLEMAKMLEADAQAKRIKAYQMDPSLKPAEKKMAAEKARIVAETPVPQKMVRIAKTTKTKSTELHASADPKPRAVRKTK